MAVRSRRELSSHSTASKYIAPRGVAVFRVQVGVSAILTSLEFLYPFSLLAGEGARARGGEGATKSLANGISPEDLLGDRSTNEPIP